jgi:hypothetical protein
MKFRKILLYDLAATPLEQEFLDKVKKFCDD